jgi:hypothetical protein
MDRESKTGDDRPSVEVFNRAAFAGLLASLFLGVAGLFGLPAVQSLTGLPFLPAFGIILLIELVAVAGITISLFNLHTERTFE